MERLIGVLHDLNSVVELLELPAVNLPPIALIGGQGHGKSAVLEALLGQQFLPRPTRVPIICHLATDLDAKSDYVEFLHAPDKRLYDFAQIAREIDSESRRLCGDRMYAASPIHLKFFSKRVLPLTIADLPGLLESDHADEKLVRDISATFVRVSSCVIVHVTDASSDVQKSPGINLAAKADSGGTRSIAVFTNLEKIKSRVPLVESLLQRGGIGVCLEGMNEFNPSRGTDIVEAALANELTVLAQHSVLGGIASRSGIPQVSIALAQMILHHVRNKVPALKMKVNGALIRCQEEYDGLRDDPMLNAEESKGALLLNLLTRYADEYRSAIDCESADNFTKELYGGARISYIFVDVFSPRLKEINPILNLTRDGIRTMIRNAKGAQPAAFVPLVCFEILVQQLLEHLHEPVLWCVDLVHTELCTIARQSMSKTLVRYPNLGEHGLEVVLELIERAVQPAKNIVSDLLKMEYAYVNTNHQDFADEMYKISEEMVAEEERIKHAKEEKEREKERRSGHGGNGNSDEPSALGEAWETVKSYPQAAADKLKDLSLSGDKDKDEDMGHGLSMRVPAHIRIPKEVGMDELSQVEIVEVALDRYYEVIRRKLADSIPKAIMYMLVNRTKKMVLNQLVSSLYQPDKFSDMLVEAEDVVSRRKECLDRMKVLQRSTDLLRCISDFTL